MGDEVNGVRFEEPLQNRSSQGSKRMMYAKMVASDEPPSVVMWLLKHGYAKTEQQAVYILFGIILAVIGIAMFFTFGGEKTQKQILEEEGAAAAIESNA